MKKNIVIIIGAAVLAGVLIILFIIFGNRGQKHFSWYESYQPQSDQPYGTSVMSDLMRGYFAGNKFEVVNNDLEEILNETKSIHTNYIFIGEHPFYTDSVFRLLKDFVSRGNDAFLSLQQIPENLAQEVLLRSITGYSILDTVPYITDSGDTSYYFQNAFNTNDSALAQFLSTSMNFNFIQPDFKTDSGFDYKFVVQNEPKFYLWQYFHPQFQSSIVNYVPIGNIYSENFCNFIQVSYGRGNFYIHTDPILFTNYYLLSEKNVEYTSKVFSYLKPGDIIWDEYSKSYSDNTHFDFQQEGPLKFILSQVQLRWAWYVIISSVFIFLIFRIKRTQQHIPVLIPNENRSLEFVQTIGRMYYIKKNNKSLALQKMKLFLHFISEHYQLSTQTIDDVFYKKLNLKSEINISGIQSIFKQSKYIENTNDVTDNDLIELHNLLDNFYKNCK